MVANVVSTSAAAGGPYDGGFSDGLDERDLRERVPERFDGYVWINRIETIAAR